MSNKTRVKIVQNARERLCHRQKRFSPLMPPMRPIVFIAAASLREDWDPGIAESRQPRFHERLTATAAAILRRSCIAVRTGTSVRRRTPLPTGFAHWPGSGSRKCIAHRDRFGSCIGIGWWCSWKFSFNGRTCGDQPPWPEVVPVRACARHAGSGSVFGNEWVGRRRSDESGIAALSQLAGTSLVFG
jgi:hypothetical protein